MGSSRYDEGMRLRRAVLGDAHVDRSLAEAAGDELLGPLQELVTEVGWGAVWTRPGLSLKERSLLNLAMLTALNRPHEFELHLRGAVRNGVTKEQIREVLIQAGAYCGWPAAIDGFRIARRVLSEIEQEGADGTRDRAER